jgi:ubiquinone/menaquinone biosynthesis C-methylase UbiE
MLVRFAQQVCERGKVCDLGCGPGQVARYLSEHGVDGFGVDLSKRMIGIVRQLSPKISFRTGNMLSLRLRDASLAGIAAFYAIVNIPRELIGAAFKEVARVLQPKGPFYCHFILATKFCTLMNSGGSKHLLISCFLRP